MRFGVNTSESKMMISSKAVDDGNVSSKEITTRRNNNGADTNNKTTKNHFVSFIRKARDRTMDDSNLTESLTDSMSCSLDSIQESDDPLSLSNTNELDIKEVAMDNISSTTTVEYKKSVRFRRDVDFYLYEVNYEELERIRHILWYEEEKSNRARSDQLDLCTQAMAEYVRAIGRGKQELEQRFTIKRIRSLSSKTYHEIAMGISLGYHGLLDDHVKEHIPGTVRSVLKAYQKCKDKNLNASVTAETVRNKSEALSRPHATFASIMGSICHQVEE
jgi:hypothetical protein